MDINNPIFQNEDSARHYLESVRWPNGPVCAHCGSQDVVKLEGKAHRPGLLQCKSCRKQFSVTVGTLFERSKIPLYKWLLATYLLSSSKKGISTHQLHRMLGITYKSAWFMTHRIREAMREGGPGLLGGGGKIVEVDETYYGRDESKKKYSNGPNHKIRILALVDRETGRSRGMVVDNLKAKTLIPILNKNIERNSIVMTDEAAYYYSLSLGFARHYSVNHSKGEYVNREYKRIHTNTIEGYFSIFKRGMKGTYQHCGEKHLHRYLSEFDFRYSNRSGLGVSDTERAENALRGIEGKRLTYRRTRAGA